MVRGRRPRAGARGAWLLPGLPALAALLIAGCGTDTPPAAARTVTAQPLPALTEAEALRVDGPRRARRLVDASGRPVQLLGTGVNALVDYGRTGLAPTPLGPEDPAQMAALGLTGVRLAVSWSRLMPAPGQLDEAELRRVTDAVRAFGEQGLFTVVSLHSDRYAADLGTGTEFDGAPRWAVRTSGRRCGDPGPRYYTPCAAAAAARFYANARVAGRGLVDWYDETAAAVAVAGASGGPGYAGLDLINEPTDPRAARQEQPTRAWRRQLARLLGTVARRVRERVPSSLLWVQPQGPRGTAPQRPTALPLRLPTGVVYAPHAYVDTFGTQPTPATRTRLRQQYAAFAQEAADRGAALAIGEFPGATGSPWDALRREHRAEQAAREIGAFSWLWKQPSAGYGWGLLSEDGLRRTGTNNLRVLSQARVLRGRGVQLQRRGTAVQLRWTAGAREVELWLGSTFGARAAALGAVQLSGPLRTVPAQLWRSEARLGTLPVSGLRLRLRLPAAAGRARVVLVAPTGAADTRP